MHDVDLYQQVLGRAEPRRSSLPTNTCDRRKVQGVAIMQSSA